MLLLLMFMYIKLFTREHETSTEIRNKVPDQEFPGGFHRGMIQLWSEQHQSYRNQISTRNFLPPFSLRLDQIGCHTTQLLGDLLFNCILKVQKNRGAMARYPEVQRIAATGSKDQRGSKYLVM